MRESGSHSRSGRFGEQKYSSPLPRFETQTRPWSNEEENIFVSQGNRTWVVKSLSCLPVTLAAASGRTIHVYLPRRRKKRTQLTGKSQYQQETSSISHSISFLEYHKVWRCRWQKTYHELQFTEVKKCLLHYWSPPNRSSTSVAWRKFYWRYNSAVLMLSYFIQLPKRKNRAPIANNAWPINIPPFYSIYSVTDTYPNPYKPIQHPNTLCYKTQLKTFCSRLQVGRSFKVLNQNLETFLLAPCVLHHPPIPSVHDLITLSAYSEKYKLQHPSVCNFLLLAVTSKYPPPLPLPWNRTFSDCW